MSFSRDERTPLSNHNQSEDPQSKPVNSIARSLAYYGGGAALVVALDQLTKYLIWHSVGPEGDHIQIEIFSWLRMIFVRNTGASFGLFQGYSGVLTVLGLGALVFLGIIFYTNARRDWVAAIALGMIAGGAIGNLIDRVRLGYVIDWIDVPRWPTFNVADSAITVGMVLLVLTILFREQEHQEPDEPVMRVDKREPVGSMPREES